ncbi:SH2B adapter protein 2 isoform X2 [Pristis pectinata]|uniref:SH2B adapter protein 2 isoform X2 n=1 Tax=Pristis pectinata TaxID=685728 RepID=UPI00223D5724|nr:SH2B adapter protein 2 isoform X2 [Pristis pectinata]XP_051891405.1 SH2B adapter protein 2 isoform X2 [Pristis pectinata]XP_051891406.1 SH2B adapter protein 2 isoform X2 [Pristis pectinata]
MNGDSGSQDSLQDVPDWKEFCEVQARAAASDFAQKFRVFISENPHYECSGIEANFSQHFASHFVEYFAREVNGSYLSHSPAKYSVAPFSDTQSCQLPPGEAGLQRKADSESLSRGDNTSNSIRFPRQQQVCNMSNLGHSRSSEDVSFSASARPKFKKGFSLRNMSMCMVDGMKEMLQWRSSAEPLLGARPEGDEDSSGSRLESDTHDKWSQKLERLCLTKLSSSKVELQDIQREGTLRYMLADDTNSLSSSQWQKCRVLLRKAVGIEEERFILEFYVPPKSTKSRVSIPLSAIVEVRTTMPLEMPDRDNTFVLKVENGVEYILETIDSLQKHSWVADIQDCMDPGDSEEDVELTSCPLAVSVPGRESPSVPTCTCASDAVTQLPVKSCTEPQSTVTVSPVRPKEVQLPQPLAHVPLENFLQTLHSDSPSTTISTDEKELPVSEMLLSNYPWFHGTLPRIKAAQLVLAGGRRSHGLFVIRQSETRPGEYVLTFNFQGKAKHLRLSVNETGQCHVQHLWFQSILDMLRHFHTHPIPLESGGSADITLRTYVLVTQSSPEMSTSSPSAVPSGAPAQPSSRGDAHQSQHYFTNTVSASPQPVAQAEGPGVTHRPETAITVHNNSSERLLQPPAAVSEDYHDSDGARNRIRAVENQYSFY